MREIGLGRGLVKAKKRFSAEQIVTLLRQIEVAMGQGKSTPLACREAGISEQSFYRWRKEYGGLQDSALGYRPPAPQSFTPPLSHRDGTMPMQ